MIVAVATAPRPRGVSYLRATLDGLEAAGATEHGRILVHDGPPPPEPCDGWRLEPVPPVPGRALAGSTRALRHALLHARDSDRVLFCEDDVVPCRNAVRAAAGMTIPEDVAFVSLFHASDRPRGRAGLELFPFPGPVYLYNQALLFPGRTVRALLHREWPELKNPNHGDVMLGRLLYDSPWPRYAVQFPNWFEHAGRVSFVAPGDRVAAGHSTWFPGPDYDALGTPPPAPADRPGRRGRP